MAIKPSELRRVPSDEDVLEAKIEHMLREGAREVDGKMFYTASGFAGTHPKVIGEVIARFILAGWWV